MFFFGRKKKRARLLAEGLDDRAWAAACARISLLQGLPPDVARRVRSAARVLLEEKHFEGCGGLELADEMSLVISCQAALLQVHPEADFFPALDSVLVYPEAFVVNHEVPDEHGLVTEGADELAGESWQRGSVILSWQDVADEMAQPEAGYNVVLHEFAHQLDEQSGDADGVPLLETGALAGRWADAFSRAYDRHRGSVRRRREILFDDNAATSPAEFFATAVELFFTLPRDLRHHFPDIHAVLAEHFALDPADW
jgi:Mlc titration factor MtfA (ptsG expression regulator)